jgi:hypothetical protein
VAGWTVLAHQRFHDVIDRIQAAGELVMPGRQIFICARDVWPGVTLRQLRRLGLAASDGWTVAVLVLRARTIRLAERSGGRDREHLCRGLDREAVASD